jgi:hypothetical protein
MQSTTKVPAPAFISIINLSKEANNFYHAQQYSDLRNARDSSTSSAALRAQLSTF